MDKLPDGWSSTDDRVPIWRAGVLFQWATGYPEPCWLQLNHRISIRPNETGREAWLREGNGPLRRNHLILFVDR